MCFYPFALRSFSPHANTEIISIGLKTRQIRKLTDNDIFYLTL